MTLLTGLALALTVSVYDESDDLQRALLILFTAFGGIFMLVRWREWRRRRSLRTEVENGATVYVWIDVDGRERRSGDDPRPGWDASSDGDGDSSGGDRLIPPPPASGPASPRAAASGPAQARPGSRRNAAA